ncbi:DNA-directed RNA polymerase subunit alpha C-terminal domain-containing protein [Paraburkholderia sp. EG304]|uniref:DNA-directed RNA polymerase subunit alpha C-terminal domain-containing protein n=1 Tax=Paraburkholderia sp. EG304 TaxID=3237015 RepID=UPI00397877B3
MNARADSRRALSIEALCLSSILTRKLRSAGIATVPDLCARRPSDLLKLTNVGPATVERIRDTLAIYGLDLLADEEVTA